MKKCKLSIMSKEIEEWRPVVGYEGLYEVSDWGNVRSVDRYVNSKAGSKAMLHGKMLKQYTDKDGYQRIGLHKDVISKTVGVHRLVAEAFIPNPNNLPVIDHINGNRQDNRVENLRWFTVKLNNSTQQAKEKKSLAAFKRTDNKVKIRQSSIDGEHIKDYNSSMDIQRELGFERAAIIRCCRGKQHTSYGYKWDYMD